MINETLFLKKRTFIIDEISSYKKNSWKIMFSNNGKISVINSYNHHRRLIKFHFFVIVIIW